MKSIQSWNNTIGRRVDVSTHSEEYYKKSLTVTDLNDGLRVAVCLSDEMARQIGGALGAGEPLFMRDCCEAMGWQGGTVHEVIKAIREMRQTKENDNKEICRLRAVTSGLESYIKELQNNGAKLLHEKDAAEARLMIRAQRHYHETQKTASLAGEIQDKNNLLIERNAEIMRLREEKQYRETFICALMKWREFNFQRLMDFLKSKTE